MLNKRVKSEFQKPIAVDANHNLSDFSSLELETTWVKGAKFWEAEQLLVFANPSAYVDDDISLKLFFSNTQDADGNNAIPPSFKTLSDFVQGTGLANLPRLAGFADTQLGANEGLMNFVPTFYEAALAKANVGIVAGLVKADDIDLIQQQAINNQFVRRIQFAASGIQTSDVGLLLADNVDTKGVIFKSFSETDPKTIPQLARADFIPLNTALQYAVLARIDTAVDGTSTLTDTLTFYFNKISYLKVRNSTLVASHTVEHDKNFSVKITKVVYQGRRKLSDELFEISFDRTASEKQVIVTMKIDDTVVDQVQILSVEDVKYVQQNYQKIMSALQEGLLLIVPANLNLPTNIQANQTVFFEILESMGVF